MSKAKGRYTVTAPGSADTPFTLTRAPDPRLLGRQRAQQPTDFERRMGLTTAPRARPMQPRPTPYCAPTPAQALDARVNNPTNRVYYYLTSQDTWRGWK